MPDRRFYTWRQPPLLRDRAYAHPGTLAVSAAAAFMGAALIANVALGLPGSHPVQVLRPALKLWVGAALTAGGALAAAGLVYPWPALNRGWRVERLGWFLQLGAWLSLALAVMIEAPAATMTWPLLLAAAATVALRLKALSMIEKVARRTLAAKENRDQDGR